MREETYAADTGGRSRANSPRPSRTPWVRIAVLSAVVSGLVSAALNVLLVPSGVGWRKLEHEGTVLVHGVNIPQKVHYPSPFSKPPSLQIEPVQSGSWFWRVE